MNTQIERSAEKIYTMEEGLEIMDSIINETEEEVKTVYPAAPFGASKAEARKEILSQISIGNNIRYFSPTTGRLTESKIKNIYAPEYTHLVYVTLEDNYKIFYGE